MVKRQDGLRVVVIGAGMSAFSAAWPWTLQRFREEMRTPEFGDSELIA